MGMSRLSTEEVVASFKPSRKKLLLVGGGVLMLAGGLVVALSGGDTDQAGADLPEDRAAATEAKAGEGQESTGTLDPAALRAGTEQVQKRAKACAEDAQMRNERLQGKLTLKVMLDGDGKVTGTPVAEDTLNDAEVTRCISLLVAGYAWPAPAGGPASFALPFVIKGAQSPSKASPASSSSKSSNFAKKKGKKR
jgi:hypothetical protein